MLGVICARAPKSWILSSVSLTGQHYGSAAHHQCLFQGRQLVQSSILSLSIPDTKRQHSSSCQLDGSVRHGGAASIWHAILPAKEDDRDRKWKRLTAAEAVLEQPSHHHHHNHHVVTRGEGSWNVALDDRPARWLHRVDSAWLLFGVCNCLAPSPCPVAEMSSSSVSGDQLHDAKLSFVSDEFLDAKVLSVSVTDVKSEAIKDEKKTNAKDDGNSTLTDFKVTGVMADGRCLFRAIAHGACLNNGEEPPDEDRQRELADELRAKVVDELLKRREDTASYIEDDFDAYLNNIKQPNVWGGEPELFGASHVLKSLIQVYSLDRKPGKFEKVTVYGEEYRKDDDSSINVLFHGYGHYDLLEKKLPENEVASKVVGKNRLDIELPENKSI